MTINKNANIITQTNAKNRKNKTVKPQNAQFKEGYKNHMHFLNVIDELALYVFSHEEISQCPLELRMTLRLDPLSQNLIESQTAIHNTTNNICKFSWKQVYQKVMKFYQFVQNMLETYDRQGSKNKCKNSQDQNQNQKDSNDKQNEGLNSMNSSIYLYRASQMIYKNFDEKIQPTKKYNKNEITPLHLSKFSDKQLKTVLNITIFFIKQQKNQLNELFSFLLLKMLKKKQFSKCVQISKQANNNNNKNKNNNFQELILLKKILGNIFLFNKFVNFQLVKELSLKSNGYTLVILCELSLQVKAVNKKVTILQAIIQSESENQSSLSFHLKKIMRAMCQNISQNSISNLHEKEVSFAAFAIISHLKSQFPKEVLRCFHAQKSSVAEKCLKICQQIDFQLYNQMKEYFSEIPYNKYEKSLFQTFKNQQLKMLFFGVKQKIVPLEDLAKYIFENQTKLTLNDYKLFIVLLVLLDSKDELIQIRALLIEVSKIRDFKFNQAILELISSQKTQTKTKTFTQLHDNSQIQNQDHQNEFIQIQKKLQDCHKSILLQLLQQNIRFLISSTFTQSSSTSKQKISKNYIAVNIIRNFSIFFKNQYTIQSPLLRYRLMKILSWLVNLNANINLNVNVNENTNLNKGQAQIQDLFLQMQIIQIKYINLSKRFGKSEGAKRIM